MYISQSSLYHRRLRQPPTCINWPVLLPSRQRPTFHFQCNNSKRAQGDSVEQRRHGVDLGPYIVLDFCGGARTELEPLSWHIRTTHNTLSRVPVPLGCLHQPPIITVVLMLRLQANASMASTYTFSYLGSICI